MRLYESSVAYLTTISNNNNNHNDNNHNINGTISGSSTVKTFTSNGNNQANSTTSAVAATPARIFENRFFAPLQIKQVENGRENLNAQHRNLEFETNLHNAISSVDDSNCFYGLNRKLKSLEDIATNVNSAVGNDTNTDNDNDVNSNENRSTLATIGFDGSSADLETEIGHMISRGNLYKLDFVENRLHLIDKEQSGSTECVASSLDGSFMDDEDEFSPAPSICVSLNSIKPSYPRGIINPNYPGFQHLAHTLSEHFIDHHHNQLGSMSDSDVSEFESDLSVERQNYLNDLNDSKAINCMENNNICDDNNGNSDYYSRNNNNDTIARNNTNSSSNLNKVEEILRTVFESNSSHLMTAIEMFGERELDAEQYAGDVMIANKRTAIDDQIGKTNNLNGVVSSTDECTSEVIACDLKTYLKRYDDEAAININDVRSIMLKKNGSASLDELPPDIIQKSKSSDSGFDSNGDKPDILQNVTEEDCAAQTNSSLTNNEKDEPGSQWSITPVDIVGNFEQEVEREFGLLVTGYSSTVSRGSNLTGEDQNEQEAANGKMLDKVTDAALSTANEIISVVRSDTKASNPFVSISSEQIKQTNQNEKHANIPVNRIADEHKPKNQIPTAIVKPKYQKSSFDDRQLPAVAYVNRDQPWYDKSHSDSMRSSTTTLSSSTSTATTAKKIHLPEFDRKAKKHLKHNSSKSAHIVVANSHDTTSNCITKENANAIDTTERDTDGYSASRVHKMKSIGGASVAVVQPRKKEKMDEQKLMETIVQMQIKKNSMDYGNRYTNNTTKADSLTHTPTTTTTKSNSKNNIRNKSNANNINNNNNNHVSVTTPNQTSKDQKDVSGYFDVYNIETALPVIDLEAIENHLKLAKEEERRKRNDREEIRRRLAMGAEDDYLSKVVTNKPVRKPSLHSRLQGGMNLQICFMNESAAAADAESPSSDSESCPKLSKPTSNTQMRYSSTTQQPHPYNSRPLSVKKGQTNEKARPTSLTFGALQTDEDPKEIDFFTKQARLQIEARMALAQAKDIAHMQMEMERQKQKESPITGIIRSSVEKVGINFPAEKRRVSRQMLTDMNVAQLQIIVNDFHSQIECLNEQLVKYLMDRDDLHMSQDSMLVDIEDLTRYLGAKKDPNHEYKKSTKRFHSMKSPKFQSQKPQPQPQHKQLASQYQKK